MANASEARRMRRLQKDSLRGGEKLVLRQDRNRTRPRPGKPLDHSPQGVRGWDGVEDFAVDAAADGTATLGPVQD
jgi:hypothetical protein